MLHPELVEGVWQGVAADTYFFFGVLDVLPTETRTHIHGAHPGLEVKRSHDANDKPIRPHSLLKKALAGWGYCLRFRAASLHYF